MNNKKRNNRCKALTKAGKRCGAAATAGGLCFLHANPNKAAELGRLGGLKNRHVVAEGASPAFAALDSAIAVRRAIAQVFNDAYSGKIHPKVASSLASLLNLELRLIDVWDMVQEIERLKKIIKEAKLQATLVGTDDNPAREETAKDQGQDQNEGATESGEPSLPSDD